MNMKKLNPIFWLKKLNAKFVEFEVTGYSGIFELANDLQNKNCKLYCEKCGGLMPMFKVVVIAKSFKIGETYEIKCRKCEHINKLIKGEWYKNE